MYTGHRPRCASHARLAQQASAGLAKCGKKRCGDTNGLARTTQLGQAEAAKIRGDKGTTNSTMLDSTENGSDVTTNRPLRSSSASPNGRQRRANAHDAHADDAAQSRSPFPRLERAMQTSASAEA